MKFWDKVAKCKHDNLSEYIDRVLMGYWEFIVKQKCRVLIRCVAEIPEK